MQISRREFLIAGTYALSGAALTACEREASPSTFQEYQKHAAERGIGLPNGSVLRYKEFSEEEFGRLNRLIDQPILQVVRTPPPSQVILDSVNANTAFWNLLQTLDMTTRLSFERDSYQLFLYYDAKSTDVSFSSEVALVFHDWVSSTSLLKGSLFPGRIEQHVAAGSFLVNPFLPEIRSSSTAVRVDVDGHKLALTVLNLHSSDPVDGALVTELMQARLGVGGLNQEQLANSVKLAYLYASGGLP